MSEIRRLTLISDPTDEFPKNANNSFKVRLPERLILPGDYQHYHGKLCQKFGAQFTINRPGSWRGRQLPGWRGAWSVKPRS